MSTQSPKPSRLAPRLALPYVLAAEHSREMGGNFLTIRLSPEVEGLASLNREQAKALSAFLAAWSDDCSPASDYQEAEELTEYLAALAPWLPGKPDPEASAALWSALWATADEAEARRIIADLARAADAALNEAGILGLWRETKRRPAAL